jgi:hypothetical protein
MDKTRDDDRHEGREPLRQPPALVSRPVPAVAPPATPPPAPPATDESHADTTVVMAIPGGQLRRREVREDGLIVQWVEIRRPDGSIWTAYRRELPLPGDRAVAGEEASLATQVLAIAAGAVGAADTARIGRTWLAEHDAAAPWRVGLAG